jgi:hypothetical protein
MGLSPAAASVEVTGTLIVGLLLSGPAGSAAAAPGAGSDPAVTGTHPNRRAGMGRWGR